jgi:D-sedoheptulose 7-phosphate isomerase
MSLQLIEKCFEEHMKTAQVTLQQLHGLIIEAGSLVVDTVQKGNTIFLCGNGGSAADAQHIAAEFTGRFVKERRGLPAIALTTDTSALTAIGNDYGYEKVFARQLEALAKPGDLLIAISTSGSSPNVTEAIRAARRMNLATIGFSGKTGGDMNELCHYNLVVPSPVTARIQEMHNLIGHILCEMVDEATACTENEQIQLQTSTVLK